MSSTLRPRVCILISCWLFLMTTTIQCVRVNSAKATVKHSDQDVDYVTVKISTGNIRGTRKQVTPDISIDTFLGIPYATPPTGEHRFSRSKPASFWLGTRDALKFGNQCAGRPMDDAPQADVPYSEDCLYLNVYAPKYSSGAKPLPVMFWIHGGGYYGGTGAIYNGTMLALRGVVVVTINYRLDIFGFLSTADSVIPGNFGMLDQILAMDWVRDNIGQFGGNPNDVTLFGQSAGASSVSLHLISPLSKGKFHKAIMESGVSLCPWATNPSNTTYYAPRNFAQILGLAVGCSHQESKSLLTCLRGIEESYLVNASIGLQLTMKHAMIWMPVVETTFGFLPDTPANLISGGHLMDIPTIRGYNKNEVAITVKDPDNVGFSLTKLLSLLVETVYFFFQKNDVEIAADVEFVYGSNQTDPYGRRSDFERMLTDYYMVAPITYEAQVMSKYQKMSKSYLYEFAYRASFDTLPVWMGVVHTDELPFVFGLPRGPAQLKFNTTNPNDIKTAISMVTLWTNFAKAGNPTPQTKDCKGSGDSYHACVLTVKASQHLIGPLIWKPVNDAPNTVLEISTNLTVGQYAREQAVDLWMKRIPKYATQQKEYNVQTIL